jgi:multiple sugar transport system permease protein
MNPKTRWQIFTRTVFILAVVAVVVVFFDIGMFTNFLTSFKSDADISTVPPKWVFRPVWTHYYNVFRGAGYNFDRYLSNSVIIGLGSTALAIVITLPAAYSIVRFRGLGNLVLAGTLLLRLMPAISLAIPIFVIFYRLHLVDTQLGIIIMHTLFLSPTALLLFMGYIQELPRELEDAAAIDGASVMQTLWHILFPIMRPGVSAVAILSFVMSWNEFLFSVVLSQRDAVTATVGTSFFIQSYAVKWGDMAAGITVSSIPTLVFIFIAQRQLIRGMTLGAVKE